jgi:hypothetical protein
LSSGKDTSTSAKRGRSTTGETQSTSTEVPVLDNVSSITTATLRVLVPSQVQPWKAKAVPRFPDQVKITWPREERPVWKHYLRICERDGHSASAEIRAWVKGQVALRAPGNPQTPLTVYVPIVKGRNKIIDETVQRLRELDTQTLVRYLERNKDLLLPHVRAAAEIVLHERGEENYGST